MTLARSISLAGLGLRAHFLWYERRPKMLSSWTRNYVPPQGRTVRVVVRMRVASVLFSVC